MTFDYTDPFHAAEIVSQLYVTQYFYSAIATALVYDSLISIDMEVKYFWNKKFGLLHVLYFSNRYIGIIGAISSVLFPSMDATTINCQYSVWVHNGANVITTIVIDYILAIRTSAMWGNPRILTTILKVLVLLESIFKLYVYVRTYEFSDYEALEVVPGLVACGRFKLRSLMFRLGLADWILPMVIGVTFLSLALYKGMELWFPFRKFRGLQLMRVLIEDQIIYYFIILFCCALNIVNYEIDLENVFLTNLLTVAGSPTFLCIFGSRMLFNLKEAAEKGTIEGSNIRTQETYSDIAFA